MAKQSLLTVMHCQFALIMVANLTATCFAEYTFQSERINRQPPQILSLPSDIDWSGVTKVVDHPTRISGSNTVSFPFGLSFRRFRKRDSSVRGIERLDYRQAAEVASEVSFYSNITRDRADAEETSGDVNRRSYTFNESDGHYYFSENTTVLSEYPFGIPPAEPRIVHHESDQARYVRVINRQDDLLTDARSYAWHKSEITDDALIAKGEVWTESLILPDGRRESSSHTSSEAKSSVTTKYLVTRPMDFILDLTLASEGDVELAARLYNLEDASEFFTAAHHRGSPKRWGLCGTLMPGEYEVHVSAETQSTFSTSGTIELGGHGEFDMYFRAFYAAEEFAVQGEPWSVDSASVPEPTAIQSMACVCAALLFFRYCSRKH